MTKQPEAGDEVVCFTHEVKGRLYSATYRRIPGLRVEVCFKAKRGVQFLGADEIEREARRILESLVAPMGT